MSSIAEKLQKFLITFQEKIDLRLRPFLPLLTVIFATLGLYLFSVFFFAPRHFPIGIQVVIPEGVGVRDVGFLLAEKKVIASPGVFQSAVLLLGGEEKIQAGEYLFAEPLSVFSVAHRLLKGNYGLDRIKVVVPEGSTVSEIAVILEKALPNFDRQLYFKLTEGEEGYLFPDTYFFFPSVETEKVVTAMQENFQKRISGLESSIRASGRTLEDIIIMASILEKETITSDDRRMVSGVLWRRLEMGMPLQVDAPFVYDIGKNTFDLSLKDLRANSPYNTYRYKGLPKGPIGNPGLDAIIGAIYPIESKYLFYLSDKKSIIHYAEDFEGHKKNRAKYLR